MKRKLLSTSPFINAAKKLVRKDPRIAGDVKDTLARLTEDIYDTRLKTHKLKGKLKGSLACSVGYDLRIVFKLVQYQDSEAILLQTIGTHDEVY